MLAVFGEKLGEVAVQGVDVAFGGRDRSVANHLLDFGDTSATKFEISGKRMAKRMRVKI